MEYGNVHTNKYLSEGEQEIILLWIPGAHIWVIAVAAHTRDTEYEKLVHRTNHRMRAVHLKLSAS